eukprot:UN14723
MKFEEELKSQVIILDKEKQIGKRNVLKRTRP